MAKFVRYLLAVAVVAVLVALAIAWWKQNGAQNTNVPYSEFVTQVNKQPESINNVTLGSKVAIAKLVGDKTEVVQIPNAEMSKELGDLLLAKNIKVIGDSNSDGSPCRYRWCAISTFTRSRWVAVTVHVNIAFVRHKENRKKRA